jgi:hypothetical protein
MMDFILELFESGKTQFLGDPILSPCINAGWSKMSKYFALTSESPTYAAIVILNPTLK